MWSGLRYALCGLVVSVIPASAEPPSDLLAAYEQQARTCHGSRIEGEEKIKVACDAMNTASQALYEKGWCFTNKWTACYRTQSSDKALPNYVFASVLPDALLEFESSEVLMQTPDGVDLYLTCDKDDWTFLIRGRKAQPKNTSRVALRLQRFDTEALLQLVGVAQGDTLISEYKLEKGIKIGDFLRFMYSAQVFHATVVYANLETTGERVYSEEFIISFADVQRQKASFSRVFNTCTNLNP